MGAVFALFAGWYYWTPKILGLDYNRLLSKVHFWILFIGVNTTGRKCFGLKGKRLISDQNKPPFNGDDFDAKRMFFDDVQASKRDIYKKLKDRKGVYMFINKINNCCYVGSSVNLSKRMATHFFHARSNQETNIVISRAMRKYGLENFSLAILEFCSPDVTDCSEFEQKWIYYYQPIYNVLKDARSSTGFKHSVETISRLKLMFSKEKHPKYGTTNSTETRQAISNSLKEFYKTNSNPYKGLKGALSPQYGIGGKSVFFYSESGKELIFPSINAAKQHFKCRWQLIKKNLDTHNWIILQGENWKIESTPRPLGPGPKGQRQNK